MVADIVIENASPTFDKVYSYLIPPELSEKALPGARVRIPFGRGNKSRTGLIINTCENAETKELKPISKVVDSPPILNEEGLAMLFYLKEHTFCTWFDAFRLLIPTGLAIKPKISYKLGDLPDDLTGFDDKSCEIIEYLRSRGRAIQADTFFKNLEIEDDHPQLESLISSRIVLKIKELHQKVMDDKITMVDIIDPEYTRLTPRQEEVMDFLRPEVPITLREAIYYTSASRSVFDNLVANGVIELYEVVRPRGQFINAEADNLPPCELSPEQNSVYSDIKAELEGYSTALLYGVTGSGKTQVFIRLVEDVVAKGQGAIVMVPEISLTSQTVTTLQSRFGNKVAVLHSGLSLGERTDEWKRIKAGDAPIVVGTRSAVFAPLESVGIIVIDEEQEHTYKSEMSPRFHARDIARLRMRYHKGLLLLCSATPSVESYYFAQKGVFSFHSLDHRYGEAQLPEVQVVDMRETANLTTSLSISAHLQDELYYNLQHKEQSILLLNRRGYSTVIKCSSCGESAECPNCSVTMTYHSASGSLICHYCGYSTRKVSSCPHCGSEFIRYSGAGTQKLEEELLALYPDARILRMDLDTTVRRDSHAEMFSAFKNFEYDILIGTQMVAKGFNFPQVTLVGVINADQSLYANDFRSYERSFSLLTQVVGRSGRGQSPGRAIIQTFTPEHPIIELAANQNYPAFYRDEIISRKLHLYPPFCTMAGVGFVGENHGEVSKWSIKFATELQRLAKAEYSNIPLRILGPAPNEILKIADKYRYKLIIKCRNDKTTREFLQKMLEWFYSNCKSVSIYIDMYYERM